jgi:hypothetical protein
MTLELSPCHTDNGSGAEFTSVSPAECGDESTSYDIGTEAVPPCENGGIEPYRMAKRSKGVTRAVVRLLHPAPRKMTHRLTALPLRAAATREVMTPESVVQRPCA